MSEAILFVAIMDRTTWKYEDPNAYRVIMIEAGHIAQNIMLLATNTGLTAGPTAALAHSLIMDHLNLSGPTITPAYVLLLGVPDNPV